MKLMKVTFGDYEVELKVRSTILSKHANEEDTLDFLNNLCLLYDESAGMCMEQFKKDETKVFYKRCAERREEISNELYRFCFLNGLYDKKN